MRGWQTPPTTKGKRPHAVQWLLQIYYANQGRNQGQEERQLAC